MQHLENDEGVMFAKETITSLHIIVEGANRAIAFGGEASLMPLIVEASEAAQVIANKLQEWFNAQASPDGEAE